MELLIKGTAKEIADLVLALQGRRKQDLFVSNIGDFKVAASAIHGKPPAVPQWLSVARNSVNDGKFIFSPPLCRQSTTQARRGQSTNHYERRTT